MTRTDQNQATEPGITRRRNASEQARADRTRGKGRAHRSAERRADGELPGQTGLFETDGKKVTG